MLHRTLAFAVQYVKLSASDIQLTFSQQDEPGPAPSVGLHLEGKDSLQLSIRQISLAPQGVLKLVTRWRSFFVCKKPPRPACLVTWELPCSCTTAAWVMLGHVAGMT